MSFMGNLLGTRDCIAHSIADYLVLEDLGLKSCIDIAMEFAEMECVNATMDAIMRVIINE